jgi:hypothetical protein
MIIDAFLGNNEIELAELRIDFLRKSVDKFFIGESLQTFSGESKDLHFSNYLSQHPELAAIMEVIVIPPLLVEGVSIDRWRIEEYQRDSFLAEIQNRVAKDDIILFCDLDEIPSISQVESCLQISDQPVNLKMVCFYRRANWLVKGPSEEWRKAKAFRSSAGRDGIRYLIFQDSEGNIGTHMSYLGMTPTQIQRKYSDFSHIELDDQNTSSQFLLDFCDEFGLNHTGWSSSEGFGLLKLSTIASQDNFQHYLYSTRRDFFASRKFAGNIFTRLIAANYVSSFLKSFEHKYTREFKAKRVSPSTLIYWRALILVIFSIVKVIIFSRLRKRVAWIKDLISS